MPNRTVFIARTSSMYIDAHGLDDLSWMLVASVLFRGPDVMNGRRSNMRSRR